jgi:DNA-binding HxlR family transcriptional regulator
MRSHLRDLTAIGVVERQRARGFSGVVEYRLTDTGREFLAICEPLGGWLATSPRDDVSLGTAAAQRTVKALVAGWTTGMLRVLAARPLSLTQLDRVVRSLAYPALERRLAAMRLAGLVEPAAERDQWGTPYVVTDWLRAAVVPLIAACRWERSRLPRTAPPMTARDVEALFLLALPLADLPPTISGTCQLAVRSPSRPGSAVGVLAEIRDGTVEGAQTRLEAIADARVLGSSAAWFAALLDQDVGGLKLGGDADLGSEVAAGLGRALARHPEEKEIP